MPTCHVVDAARLPWKRGHSEGIAFACQVLLAGEDGGPEAFRFRFDDCPSVYAHMHLTAQFQLLLAGAMDFPRGVKHLQAPAIHYTDHNVPYGPFAVSGGHDMLVLHPRAGGLIAMTNLNARRRINLRGRLFAALASEQQWQALPQAECGSFKQLVPPGFGPAAVMVRAPANARLGMPPAPHGRYEVVLEGSVIMHEREIGAPGLRYSCGEDEAEALITGPAGACVAFLTFDHDALEGGITDEPMAVAAAQAMARAI